MLTLCLLSGLILLVRSGHFVVESCSLFLFIDSIPSSEYMRVSLSVLSLMDIPVVPCWGLLKITSLLPFLYTSVNAWSTFTCKPIRCIPRRRGTTLPQFAQEFPSVSTESPTSQETPQSQASWNGRSHCLGV